MSDLGCLIAYYSRKGQNYRSGDVVDLPVGNTEVAARMIQAATSGDLLHLETVKEYPEDYHEATEVASIDGCDVLFLGYPNWWGTPPMAVFTFLESHDFSGKTIIPFSRMREAVWAAARATSAGPVRAPRCWVASRSGA